MKQSMSGMFLVVVIQGVIQEEKPHRENWILLVYAKSKLTEELPAEMLKQRGQGFTKRAYVDSDHTGDSVTRRSRTGFIVYFISAPFYLTSKKEITCKTSTF